MRHIFGVGGEVTAVAVMDNDAEAPAGVEQRTRDNPSHRRRWVKWFQFPCRQGRGAPGTKDLPENNNDVACNVDPGTCNMDPGDRCGAKV